MQQKRLLWKRSFLSIRRTKTKRGSSINLEELKDEDLILELQKNNSSDTKAFELLLDRHADKFYALAFRTVFNKNDAEDIVQEAFLKLFKNPFAWKAEQKVKFTTWFYKVVVNLCIDFNRKKTAHSSLDDELNHKQLASNKNIEKEFHKKERGNFVNECLKLLAERQRIAINLCFYHGLSNKEAAEAMDIKVKALESLLMRGKQQLKKLAEGFYQTKEIQS